MKVMLIQPPSSFKILDGFFISEPLGLEYLGAALKQQQHEVIIHDTCLEADYEFVFCAFQPDVVGLTGYSSHLSIVKGIAAKFKLIDPRLFIIVGGHHATFCPEDYNCPDIDLVVRGEGVYPLMEIMHNLEEGKPFENIAGLGISGPKMVLTAYRPYPALDSLPAPDRSLTQKYRSSYFLDWLMPLASMRTSVGCVSRCNFCSNWVITDGRYMTRHPAKIVEELASISEDKIYFADDESMLDWRRMDLLADLIKEAGIKKKYYLYARVDTIINHPDLFAKWKEIGLIQLFVGFESYTNKRLGELNKGITVGQQEKAIKILSDLKINIEGGFMVESSFTKKDFSDMYDYIRLLNPTAASVSVLTPLPGTVLYKNSINTLTTHKPELYDAMSAVLPTSMPLKDFYAEYASLLSRISLGDGPEYMGEYDANTMLKMQESYEIFINEIRQKYLSH